MNAKNSADAQSQVGKWRKAKIKLPNYHPDQSRTVQNTGIETQPDKATKLASRYLDATEPEDSELRTLQAETDAANVRAAEIKFSKSDKATVRPWRTELSDENPIIYGRANHELGGELAVAQIDYGFNCEANAALIVKAVNEHAALEAVAEAVEQHIIYGDMPKEVQVAITNLAAIREQKAGAK